MRRTRHQVQRENNGKHTQPNILTKNQKRTEFGHYYLDDEAHDNGIDDDDDDDEEVVRLQIQLQHPSSIEGIMISN